MTEKQFLTDSEINLLDYWHIIWKRKIFIIVLIFISTIYTLVTSLSMTDIYQAKAVIMPIANKEAGGGGLSSIAQQFGGIAGISMPGSSSASEIDNLLKSNILLEKVIEKYNLLPVLFYKQWDEGKKDWKKDKKGSSLSFSSLGKKISELIMPENQKIKSKITENNFPGVWDGIRMLNNIFKINKNNKDGMIIITLDLHDREMAAKIIDFFLIALNDHMSSEVKRVAKTNKKYLEEQLGTTADPLIRQKINNLISLQVETTLMSEVKENFAFKIIDPPRVPDKKIRPNRQKRVIMSFFISSLVGIFVAFILENFKKMKSQEAIK